MLLAVFNLRSQRLAQSAQRKASTPYTLFSALHFAFCFPAFCLLLPAPWFRLSALDYKLLASFLALGSIPTPYPLHPIFSFASFARVTLSPIFSSSPNLASFAPLRESSFIQSSPLLRTWRLLRELSFLRFPKPKFNGKFQICLVSLP